MNSPLPHIEHLTVSDDDLLRMTIMNKTVVSETGCWEWRGATSTGYGIITRKRARLYVHRLAYELWHQPIPDGMVIRHQCDNPACVNPNHLLVGTQADNIRDIVERGRHGSSKLTEAQVHEIRASRESTYALAERFGVRRVAINRARRGATWAHIDGRRPVGKGYSAVTGRAPHSKINASDADLIRSSTLSNWLLASIYGLTRKSIANIRNGVTWKAMTQITGGDFAG